MQKKMKPIGMKSIRTLDMTLSNGKYVDELKEKAPDGSLSLA